MTHLDPAGAMPVRRRAVTTLGAWIALLVATLAGVPRVAPRVPGPDIGGGLSAIGAWSARTHPAFAFAALLRLVVVALAAYLLATTLAAVAARAWTVRSGGDPTSLDRFVLPPIRRIVALACGVSLSVATLTVVDRAAAGLRVPVVAARPAPAPTTATTPPSTVPPTTLGPRTSSPGPVATLVTQAAESGDGDERTVAPGESFWSIAEDALAAAWSRRPSDADVDPYWRALVETNRDRLGAPGVPDLLYPGQRLRLPPPPQPPAARRP